MSGIAELLANPAAAAGPTKRSDITDRLASMGVRRRD